MACRERSCAISMMDLLVIQPPASFNNQSPVLPQNSVGIGMLTILAYIKSKGFSGKVIHFPRAFEDGYKEEEVFEKVKEMNPRVISIGLNWLHFSEGAIQVAEKLRKICPDTTILIGGQHASLFAEEIVRKTEALDGVLLGESERTLARVLETKKDGCREVDKKIPGVITVDGENRPPEIVEELDSLPFYTYDDVWPYRKEICAALDTVRGECIRDCSYCIASKTNSIQGRKKFTAHSPKYLADQVEVFYKSGIENVTIQDPFCMIGQDKIEEFCNHLVDKKIKLKQINIFIEPMTFRDSTVDALNSIAEMVTLDYGLETGSAAIAKGIGREYDKDKILKEISKLSKKGIKISTWWMTGLPGDNRASIEDSMSYIEDTIKHGAMPRWVTPLILFPHTDMSKNNFLYGIKTKMKSFDDFCNYSKVEVNNYGVYPELLTHETTSQSGREIVESTIAIKKGIVDRMIANKDKLIEHGWNDKAIVSIIEEATGSFY